MKKRIPVFNHILLLIAGVTVFIGIQGFLSVSQSRLCAQTESAVKEDVPAEKPVTSDEVKKDEKMNITPGAEARKGETKKSPVEGALAAVKSGKPVQPGIENPAGADGLLDISEGAFKYRRIPGIKISEVAPEIPAENLKAKDQTVENKAIQERGESKGLFGFSQKTTDLLAKLVLFGVVLLVFILYRYRTHGRRSGVLKRFPKA